MSGVESKRDQDTPFSPACVRLHLKECGYHDDVIVENLSLPNGNVVPLAAFARRPLDVRSACLAFLNPTAQPERAVTQCFELGAPLIFIPKAERWQIWRQRAGGPEVYRAVDADKISTFFRTYQKRLSPASVYRAKTWARVNPEHQIDFVDVGLLPVVEQEAGDRLANLVEQMVAGAQGELGWRSPGPEQAHWLLKANFWLLAARMLKDKQVESFTRLNIEDLPTVFARVAKHYGASAGIDLNARRLKALEGSAQAAAAFGSLRLVSTEALAHVYESALITKRTRKLLGTHRTPGYLVDYILAKLQPWIEQQQCTDRTIYEPACGHAPFLLGSVRLLTDLLPESTGDAKSRHDYLRARLRGCDRDPFALEIARLSLTLADVPHPNGWHLEETDMFSENVLAKDAGQASVILCNPPYERVDLSADEQRGGDLRHVSQAAELVRRVIGHMKPGSVFGFVVPQTLLDSEKVTAIRKDIATNFEVREISIFPDKMFEFADVEATVLIGRRVEPHEKRRRTVTFYRVRETGMEEFRRSYRPTSREEVEPSFLQKPPIYSFLVPELTEVWNLCRHLPKFASVATIERGLEYRSPGDPAYPAGELTHFAERPVKGNFQQGFFNLSGAPDTHLLPKPVWMNLNPQIVNYWMGGRGGQPQVIMNHARVSRSQWRIKAYMDPGGHPARSRFLVIKPKEQNWRLEIIWAICTSPFANAFVFAHENKRDINANLMRQMPVPNLQRAICGNLVSAVRAYFRLAQRFTEACAAHSGNTFARRHSLKAERKPDSKQMELTIEQAEDDTRSMELELRYQHWRIDAEVLSLYGLPAQAERKLLDLFSGVRRVGVPFEQTEYIPCAIPEISTLSELLEITAEWDATNDQRCDLIDREIEKGLTVAEEKKLARLQHLASLHGRLIAPLPMEKLANMERELRREGLWVE
jgi:type I restriction-modification system DNA methylase subunit